MQQSRIILFLARLPIVRSRTTCAAHGYAVMLLLADVGLTSFHVHVAQHGLHDRGPMADSGHRLTAALEPGLTSSTTHLTLAVWQCVRMSQSESVAVVALTCLISLSLSISMSCTSFCVQGFCIALCLVACSWSIRHVLARQREVGEHRCNNAYRI